MSMICVYDTAMDSYWLVARAGFVLFEKIKAVKGKSKFLKQKFVQISKFDTTVVKYISHLALKNRSISEQGYKK